MHKVVLLRHGESIWNKENLFTGWTDEVLAFAELFVARVAAAHPDELTVEHSIATRGDCVYLDPFRNGFGQTVVPLYSVRRREKAPVSIPLEWSEAKPALIPSDFNRGNFAKRLKRTGSVERIL
jgi:bifunctional non-homologous end joining protein LigD